MQEIATCIIGFAVTRGIWGEALSKRIKYRQESSMDRTKSDTILLSWFIAAVLIVVLSVIIAVTFYNTMNPNIFIPKCQEDEVLMGVGEFDDGRWDRYICENID